MIIVIVLNTVTNVKVIRDTFINFKASAVGSCWYCWYSAGGIPHDGRSAGLHSLIMCCNVFTNCLLPHSSHVSSVGLIDCSIYPLLVRIVPTWHTVI